MFQSGWFQGTPCQDAINRHKDELRTLVEGVRSGLVDVNAKGPGVQDQSLLLAALRLKEFSDAEYLLDAGADIHVPDKQGATVLLLAAQVGHVAIVERLLQAGVSVNAAGNNGDTALMRAVEYDCAAVVDVLLAAGAQPNTANASGNTALMSAANGGRLDIIDSLLAHGADLHARDSRQYTAMVLASTYKHTHAVKYLLDCGAELEATSKFGETALLRAAGAGDADTAEVLLRHGANGHVVNAMGWSPLSMAAAQNHPHVVAQMLAAGPLPTREGTMTVQLKRLAHMVYKHRDKQLDSVPCYAADAAMEDPMVQYCTGRFTPLQAYFKGVLASDLLRMEGEFLVASASNTDKILMRAFILTPLIHGLLRRKHPPAPSGLIEECSHMEWNAEPEYCVDLSRCFRSNQIHGYEMDILRNESREVFSVSAVLQHVHQLGLMPANVQSLDISACFLHDEDIALVPELMGHFPACNTLILSSNSNLGSDNIQAAKTCSILTTLLKEKKELIVSLIGCRALLDARHRRWMFDVLALCELNRLIWVPSPWLEGMKCAGNGSITWEKEPAWLHLVKERSDASEAIQAILQGHMRFYGMLNDVLNTPVTGTSE